MYLAEGGVVNVSVQDGQYAVTWINAQDTSDRRQSGTTDDGKNLSSPSGGDDWLLFLSTPGTSSVGRSGRQKREPF